ncbi:hypothetical protein VTO42DRAFT_6834 [Malbranchea cinnamomea]
MQTVHRQFGKLMKRTADESQVSVLLKDFENADKLLGKIIESSKAWRDAWSSILTYQFRLVQEFEGLYCPIIGSSEPTPRPPAPTPEATLARTARLKEEYELLRTELLVEVTMVDEKMIKPAMQAKDYLQPIKKVIKKREDKKLDFEHYQNRVDTSRKKTKRTDRDNAVLAKAEADLCKAKDEYNAADDHLRAHLPGLISATFSLLPHLLAAQIEIQNTLLALYYTTLHNYCLEQQLPSPPPPMETVIQTWENAFVPIQREVEALACVASGKTVRHPRNFDEHHKNGLLPNGFGVRRVSNQSPQQACKPSVSPVRNLPPPSPVMETKPRLNGSQSPSSPPPPPPPLSSLAPKPRYYSPDSSTDTHSYPIAQAHASSFFPPTNPRSTDQRQPSASFHASDLSSSTAPQIASMAAAAAAAKKPPPPPPPPRNSSSANIHYVTALYDFDGESPGDLSFREGDRIRVIKKSESTDDWWEGELRGVRGSFPANYCA